MKNQIETIVNTAKLIEDYPDGKINIPNPSNYVSYNILSWSAKDPATATENAGIWTLDIPGSSKFMWYAVPQGETIDCQDIYLFVPEDSDAFASEGKGPTISSYKCKMKDYNPHGGNESGCTLEIRYPADGGNIYSWDPKIIVKA